VVAGLLAGPIALPPLLQQASAADHQVNIQGLQFNPADITANVGDQVVWTSHDPDTHGVTGGPMSSPDLHNGDTWRFTVSQPGDITYGCRFHPSMHGTIKVMGSGGGGAPAPQPGGPAPAPAPPPAPGGGGGLPDIGALLAQLLGGLLGGVPHSVPAPGGAPVVAPAAAPALPPASRVVGMPGPSAGLRLSAVPSPGKSEPNAAPGSAKPEPDAAPKPGRTPGISALPTLAAVLDPGGLPALPGLS
jgi:plastocyanin